MGIVTICSLSKTIFGRSLSVLNPPKNARDVGFFQSNFFSSLSNSLKSLPSSNLNLTPFNPLLITSCGMKIRGQLALRCKDCYMARKDGVMHVFCSSYPRHKQRALTPREKYTWILTSASQSKKRPY